ncbi:hypothetical protein J437_LFUL009452 [Ladona fulva]|uniref:RAP domain-containing protein n=1 Tax=Ladona fulva TaxID=123851 RepID=A0A8K0K9X8_LADFU|nr:hypothetical protein J437_LFUL009452 [Ladona fulva]
MLDRNSFCHRLGSTKPHLRGLPLLHKRHLELLGYQVVLVPVFHWDSMQMASKEARYNFLKEKIFGSED